MTLKKLTCWEALQLLELPPWCKLLWERIPFEVILWCGLFCHLQKIESEKQFIHDSFLRCLLVNSAARDAVGTPVTSLNMDGFFIYIYIIFFFGGGRYQQVDTIFS